MQTDVWTAPKNIWSESLPLAVVFILALAIRVVNLNYNSPFNDEAIYIVLGKMGLFLRDWWTYNAQSWVAGLPYLYPSFSALAYVTGGIVGSRLLSVLFGLLTIGEVYQLTEAVFHKDKHAKAAAIIASIVV